MKATRLIEGRYTKAIVLFIDHNGSWRWECDVCDYPNEGGPYATLYGKHSAIAGAKRHRTMKHGGDLGIAFEWPIATCPYPHGHDANHPSPR